jgi:hypothetical protein
MALHDPSLLITPVLADSYIHFVGLLYDYPGSADPDIYPVEYKIQ